MSAIKMNSTKTVEEALQKHVISTATQSPTELIKMYDDWSNYDELTGVVKYIGPNVVADAVVKYLPHTRDVRVLDVAAGTGQVGEQLNAHGFKNIDALDASEGMLNIARQKNVYRNCIQEFFPCENPSVKRGCYDVLAVAGGLAESHMACDSLPEMVRCVKKGGLVVISMTKRYLIEVAEFKERLEPLMEQLQIEGQWQMLERTVIPDVYHANEGLLYVFKVTN